MGHALDTVEDTNDLLEVQHSPTCWQYGLEWSMNYKLQYILKYLSQHTSEGMAITELRAPLV